MINFLLLMILPVIISLGYFGIIRYKRQTEHGYGRDYYRGRYDAWRNAGVQIGAAAVIALIGLGIAYYQGTSDTEIWNGQITNKAKLRVSCEHSYPCNCRSVTSGSGKTQTTSIECDTCYEHSYDIDWRIYASTSEELNIDRVDDQGLRMPQRWGAAYIGEPFASQHRFTNYIKANPSSVLLGQKGDLKKFGSLIPVYPKVYDYYRVAHIYNMNVPVSSDTLDKWQWLLAEANKTLGTQKQVNIIVVLANTDDPAYTYAFRDAWIGGKKNDAVILIGSTDGHEITWVDVVSWGTNKEFNIYVRDRILAEKSLDRRDAIVNIISEEVQTRFVRLHMKKMEWLIRGFQPSGAAMLYILLAAVSTSLIACVLSFRILEGY